MTRGHRFPLASFLPTALLVCAGCGGTSTTVAADATFADSAGVVIVRNGGTDLRGEDVLVVELQRTIGFEGDERYEFDRIGDLAVARDGTIFVGSNGAELVRMYGVDGAYVRAFVRRGRGPGELTRVERLTLLGDTALAVGFTFDQQMPVFSPAGEPIHVPLAISEPVSSTIMAADERGWIALRIGGVDGVPSRHTTRLAADETWTLRATLHSFDPSTGQHRDSLGVIDILTATWDPVRDELVTPLFWLAPDLVFDGSGRLLLVRTPYYRIERYAAGRLERVILRDVPTRVAGPDVLEGLREQIRSRDWITNWPGSGPPFDLRDRDLRSLDWQWEREERRLLPVIRSMLADESGAFWVERVDHLDPLALFQRPLSAMDVRADGSRWDMFDPDGRYIATITLPPLFVPMHLNGTDVTGVQRDELDIERVATYRVSAR